MHKVLIFLFGLLLSVNMMEACSSWAEMASPQVEVYFSPRGGAQNAIIQAIAQAEKEIFVMAYSFTATSIANAPVLAHKRGLNVLIILDKSQCTARASKIQELVSAHIPTFIDKAHAVAHNKVIIIDKKLVITVSYNFSQAAEERNAENLLFVYDTELARRYLMNFRLHLRHSTPFAVWW